MQLVGQLPELSFAKNTIEFKKLREYDLTNPEEHKFFDQSLGMILSSAANLSGIKQEISEPNKKDVFQLIMLRFKGLSLEEISQAFKYDRFGIFGDVTQHFQLFNSEYVGTILNKYKKWLTDIRIKNNLPIAKQLDQTNDLTEEKKNEIVKSGVIRVYKEFLTTGCVPEGSGHVYDTLYDLGVLPVHTVEFREAVKSIAIRELKSDYKKKGVRSGIKKALAAIEQNQNQIKAKCKQVVLNQFFSDLQKEETNIETIIK